ncbi:ABC transporter permease [Tepidiforma sp.]|jgi:peptide/nickel transport system permease protein|uniref:ABC transporter permease n=1 Tax=Tepidiforma sp. TaxID=2682230 RepID=UPI0021DE6A22|nr:ABC transporter permease [Tepidiforma sp.]MCX7617011.1 ABC transporter permease [Tepidiforma sp.]GIW18107.1 MAG: peptide ABC transporter [Tepidiforma sp.]
MQRYILRRLLLMVPTLLGVTFVVFVIVRAVPGDVVDLVLGEFGAGDQATKEAIRKEFGLEGNIVAQYVRWLGDIVQFDLGRSLISNREVTSELRNRLPVTFQLGAMAIFFSLLIAIPVGVISAIRQDTWADYAGRSFAIGLLAAPNFWIAILLISLAARYFQWGVPPAKYIPFTDDPIGNLKLMFMPALILGGGLSGSVMRFTRSSMLEVLRQDYIRTAWAKGLRERVIIIRHAMRNALIPVITVVGLQLPVLVGGTVIIETVYSIPGMGRYYVSSIDQKDYPVIQAVNIVVALVVVFANLTVDVLYSVIDPRIRYS